MIKAFIGAALLIYAAGSGIHALMTKRNPPSTAGWTLVCIFVPASGTAVYWSMDADRSLAGWLVLCVALPLLCATLYWFFGFNRIETKALRWRRRGRFNLDAGRDYGKAEVDAEKVMPERAHTLATLTRISERVTRRPLLRGNTVKPLFNGDQAYPTMLEAIDGAETSVYLCTYLFDTDDLGMKFVDALCRAADRGVDVRVLVDAIGERYSTGSRVSKYLGKNKAIKVARFLPLVLNLRRLRINLRNHRKILIVDGVKGFTGGMNIGGRNLVNDPDNPHKTADLHFSVTGPVVHALEDMFFEDWNFATGEDPPWGEDETCPHEPTGEAMCRAISDGPNEDFEVLTWILVGALSAARERIQIITPYFIPSRELLSALNAAALRGVRVDILLPSKNNVPPAAWAAQAMLGEVLTYGTKVYQQPEPFNHSKLLIVDEFYVLLGSANLDPRSLRLNFEFNLEVYDSALGAEMSAHFDEVLARSQPITIESLNKRPAGIKVRDAIAKLFAPYL